MIKIDPVCIEWNRPSGRILLNDFGSPASYGALRCTNAPYVGSLSQPFKGAPPEVTGEVTAHRGSLT